MQLTGPGETVLPVDLGLPSELLQLVRVDGVPPVVEGPVFDVLEELRLAVLEPKLLDKRLGEVQVGDLKVGTNVVDLADDALVQDGVDGIGNVRGVDVTTRVGAVSVEADLLAALEKADKLGDDLLRVLVRSVDVVAAGNDDGQVEGFGVGLDEHLGSGFGGRVRVGGLEHGLFEEVGVGLAVDFVCGDVDHLGDVAETSRFQKNVGANNVVFGELERVAERVVCMNGKFWRWSGPRGSGEDQQPSTRVLTDVTLSRKVNDGVNVAFLEHVEHEVDGLNVAWKNSETKDNKRLLGIRVPNQRSA